MPVILFDLDGTLQDSEKLAAEATQYGFRAVLEREPTPAELAYLVGKPMTRVFASWFPDRFERVLEEIVAYWEQRLECVEYYAGVPEMTEELHRLGFRMGVVTAKKRKDAERDLMLRGLLHLFETVVGQEDTEAHKPDPEPLLLAAARMGVSPADCIYIGDQPTDVQAANAAGMRSAGALWGEGSLERLTAASPALIFDTPRSVLLYLQDVKSA